ncbi:MAG: EAL domain-containing protein [Pseudolabrys sp.]
MRKILRKKLFAVVAGLLLGAAPLLALDAWMTGLIERQGERDAESSAQRALSLAEKRTAQAEAVLERLSQRGPPNCSADYIALLHTAVFDTTPLKEISVLDSSGTVLCTSSAVPIGVRNVMATERLSGSKGLLIDVMDLGGGLEMIRVRTGGQGLAALVPNELFLPKVTTSGAEFKAHARMTTSGGMEIASSGEAPADMSKHFRSQLRSEKYGYAVEVAIPRAQWAAKKAELRWMSAFPVGGVALLLIVVAYLRPKQDEANPVEDMRRALANGEFIPYYQPIVDIRSGQLRGAEVLMRWRKPDGTIVPPGVFIPLAESSGLIREMTTALMKKVCVEAGPAIGRRRAMKVSFNFAAQFFSDDSIVKQVQQIFSKSPIKLSQVVFELTERDSIENFTETRRVVAALQGLGARIAIDDVGTGHSGLSYMLKLGVDIIKIDKMFVDAIGTDRNSTTIVETLIDLAHNMRMDIIAEGVETFEQVIHLRELGIRHAQGYVFAPPLPGSSFLQLVDAIDPEKLQSGDVASEAVPSVAAG